MCKKIQFDEICYLESSTYFTTKEVPMFKTRTLSTQSETSCPTAFQAETLEMLEMLFAKKGFKCGSISERFVAIFPLKSLNGNISY